MTPPPISEIDWQLGYPVASPPVDGVHVRMNFVSSADGAVTLDGRSGGLGGSNDRELMRVLRAQSDVVLVGAGTVRAEGYGGLNLPPNHLERRRELGLSGPATTGGAGPVTPPPIAIVSGSLNLTPDMSVFQKAEVRPLIFTHGATPVSQRRALEEVAEVIICGDSAVDLGMVLKDLAARGLGRVLCEGGPGLFGSLLEGDLVDEVCLTVAPLFVAGHDARISHSIASHPRRFTVENLLQDDEGFVFLRYARTR